VSTCTGTKSQRESREGGGIESPPLTRSSVRTRVARRDWWASLIVVSVRRTLDCCRTHAAKASGPRESKIDFAVSGVSIRGGIWGAGAFIGQVAGASPRYLQSSGRMDRMTGIPGVVSVHGGLRNELDNFARDCRSRLGNFFLGVVSHSLQGRVNARRSLLLG
jgi:hypothetical protein